MRMQPFVRRDVLQPDLGAGDDVLKRQFVPGIRGGCVGGGPVGDSPEVVVVAVWVEGDLLFYGG